MTKDLKDHVFIKRETLMNVLGNLQAHCNSFTCFEQEEIRKALNQDLSGMVLKPKTETKFWLWKNFVDGRPEYWAFDNPYPVYLNFDDPQTVGEPCGYAIFKESRCGRTGFSEEEVLKAMLSAAKEKNDV